jgi:hypothetical protein
MPTTPARLILPQVLDRLLARIEKRIDALKRVKLAGYETDRGAGGRAEFAAAGSVKGGTTSMIPSQPLVRHGAPFTSPVLPVRHLLQRRYSIEPLPSESGR